MTKSGPKIGSSRNGFKPESAVGRLMRAKRTQLGVTLEQMGLDLDISRNQLWTYDAGKASLPYERVKSVASYLNIPEDELTKAVIQDRIPRQLTAQGWRVVKVQKT